MKKLIWTALVLSLSLPAVSSITPPAKASSSKTTGNEEPKTRAKKLSEDMKRALKLSVNETERIYQAFLDEFKKERMMREEHAVEASLKKVADETDVKIRDILGEIKYANYKTMKKDDTKVEEKK